MTWRLVIPEFAASQLAPLSVERNTPPDHVPARRYVWPPASIPRARAVTFESVRPSLARFQVAPSSVDRKTPLGSIPAKRYLPPAPFGHDTMLWTIPSVS